MVATPPETRSLARAWFRRQLGRPSGHDVDAGTLWALGWGVRGSHRWQGLGPLHRGKRLPGSVMKIQDQGTHGLLRTLQVASLEGFSDGLEILLALASEKWVGIGKSALLAKLDDGLVCLLCARQIAGLERLPQLLQVRHAVMEECLQLLDQRAVRNGCRGHERLLI